MTSKHSVLFICTANICRSPLAMGLLQGRVGKENPAWRIESAGTWAMEGEPAAENTIQVLLERGIDISHHRSRPIDQRMIDDFQLIITMERGHKEGLRIEFPRAARKIFLFSEMENQIYDISDPMGSPLNNFRAVARELEELINRGLDKITRLSDSSQDDHP